MRRPIACAPTSVALPIRFRISKKDPSVPTRDPQRCYRFKGMVERLREARSIVLGLSEKLSMEIARGVSSNCSIYQRETEILRILRQASRFYFCDMTPFDYAFPRRLQTRSWLRNGIRSVSSRRTAWARARLRFRKKESSAYLY